MKSSEFADRFTGLTQQLVQLYYDHAEGDARVSRIYIFIGIDELSEVNAFYSLGKQFATTAGITTKLGLGELSTLELSARLAGTHDILDGYLTLFADAHRRRPTVMKMVYDVKAEDLQAALTYAPITDELPAPTLFTQWWEDVRDGADPLPSAGDDVERPEIESTTPAQGER